jgi:electron transport complex protein RnfG
MASKKKSSFVNMVVVLMLVASIAATALASVYQVTKGPIEKAKLEKDKNAVGNVVPEFNNDPVSESDTLAFNDQDQLIFYPAKMNDKLVGMAVKTYSDLGFTERIKIMVGFTVDGKIVNTKVLEHKETPGLGDKMDISKSTWCEQFMDLNINELEDSDGDDILIEVKNDQGTIDAITAATITSRAFCDACERAWDELEKKLTEEKTEK